jgi:hypothetical protein
MSRASTKPAGPENELSVVRLSFRFIVGGAALAGEWLGSALRAIDELPVPAEDGPALARSDARAIAIGALSAALRWRPGSKRPAAASRLARGTLRTGARALALLPGSRLATRPYRRFRDRLVHRLRRWGEEGAREHRAGRRLARVAAPVFAELAVSRLADSPQLQKVIHEQSEGLAASSVNELRERSEAADRAVERTMGRLLGRGRTSRP